MVNSKKTGDKQKCMCCNSTLKKNKSHNIFDECGKNIRIQFLLAECVQKLVYELSGTVQAICSDCLNQLQQSYAFKLKCKNLKTDDDDDDGDEEEEEDTQSEVSLNDQPDNVEVIQDEPYNGNKTIELEILNEVAGEYDHVSTASASELRDQNPEHTDYPTRTDEIDVNVAMETEVLEDYDSIQTTQDLSTAQITEHYLEDVLLTDVTDVECANPDPDALKQIDGLGSASTSEEQVLFDPANRFVESLTVHSIKEKIRFGIPVHAVHCTSNRENDSASDCEDRSERPDRSETRLQLDDEVPIDVDEYVMSIVSVSFNDYSEFQDCVMCNLCEPAVRLINYTDLAQHTNEHHSCLDATSNEPDGQFICCLDSCGALCSDLDDLRNHQFVQHGGTINASCFLTCQTCDLVTESLAKFGKHICSSLKETATDPLATTDQPIINTNSDSKTNYYACVHCDQKLRSHRRHMFHQQFHIANARPKLCLICERLFANEHRFYEHVQFAHDQFAQHFCRYCDRSFTSPDVLRRHEHAHTAIRTHQCNDCDKAFFDLAALVTHRRLHEVSFTCDHCGKLFNRKFRLRKHMAQHVPHKPAVMPVCEACGRLFVTQQLAQQHWDENHSGDDPLATAETDAAADMPLRLSNVYVENAFCCEYCEAAFEQVSFLLTHKAAHDAEAATATAAGQEPQKFQCEHCPRRFTHYARLRSHVNAHSAAQLPYPVKRMFVCELDNCRKPYADWNNYQTHRKTVHLVNPSIIRCQLCDEVFYKSWLYSYHKKSVHQAHHQCPMCPLSFVLQRALAQHIRRVHINEEVDGLSDPGVDVASQEEMDVTVEDKPKGALSDFGKKTVNSDRVVQQDVHFTALTDSAGFKCLQCGKIASRRSNLVAHVQMVHLKVRNFKCTQCDKTFFQRGDLGDHLKMHFAITPYDCPYCDYKMRTKSMLKLHIRSHTNERPYQCGECPKAFKRQLVLTNHMKLHTGVKEFACETCGLAFFSKYTLKTHEKTKHQNRQVTPSKSGRQSLARTKPSMIIVMPGPPDRQNRKIVAAAAGKAVNQDSYQDTSGKNL